MMLITKRTISSRRKRRIALYFSMRFRMLLDTKRNISSHRKTLHSSLLFYAIPHAAEDEAQHFITAENAASLFTFLCDSA